MHAVTTVATSQTADDTTAGPTATTGAEQSMHTAMDARIENNQHIDDVTLPAAKLSVNTGAKDKRSSTFETENGVPSIAIAPTEDGEVTPLLPNGEKRLHPLFDEDKIASEAAALSKESAMEPASEPATEGRPKALRLLDTMSSDQGYPSPSGGFVPPVTDEGWALKAPPPARGAAVPPASAPPTVASTNLSDSTAPSSKPDNRLSSFSTSNATLDDEAFVDRPVRPPSLPSSHSTSERIRAAGAGSASGSRRPSFADGASQPLDVSSDNSALLAANIERQVQDAAGPSTLRRSDSASSDRSSLLGGKAHSQAISARSSPSTTAPVRRRSSTSADVLHAASSEAAALNALLPPLKVRDYAYTEFDPRHIGARDVGLPSVDEQEHSDDDGGMGRAGRIQFSLGRGAGGGGEWGRAVDDDEGYDDSDEDDDDTYHNGNLAGDDLVGIDASSSATGLPIGLYHAAYDFNAESEHELDVKVGQRVRLIGHVDGGWAIVVRVPEGQSDVAADEEQVDKGLVPEAYLEWLAE